jgi:predicted rRNA methylase YqxC with S4 and FtsJ domains
MKIPSRLRSSLAKVQKLATRRTQGTRRKAKNTIENGSVLLRALRVERVGLSLPFHDAIGAALRCTAILAAFLRIIELTPE